jgi:hypothetical protein
VTLKLNFSKKIKASSHKMKFISLLVVSFSFCDAELSLIESFHVPTASSVAMVQEDMYRDPTLILAVNAGHVNFSEVFSTI